MRPDPDQPSRARPFSHDLTWLVQSLALMRQQAGRLLLIALIMQIILGLTQVPLIGILIVLSVPGLSAGVLQAFDVTRKGGHPGPNLLFRPLMTGTHTGRFFLMGALIFAIGVICISLVLSGSEELLNPDLMSRIEQGDVNAIAQLDQESLGRILLAFLLGVSISGTLSFFSIPLIWFGDRKLGPALTEGISALLVNWKPFLMLALGLAAILAPVALVSGILFGLAGTGGILSVIVMGAIMILLLGFQMILFGTQYCAYRDVFGIRESAESGPPEDDSQLVA
jgi:hypothetical protein